MTDRYCIRLNGIVWIAIWIVLVCTDMARGYYEVETYAQEVPYGEIKDSSEPCLTVAVYSFPNGFNNEVVDGIRGEIFSQVYTCFVPVDQIRLDMPSRRKAKNLNIHNTENLSYANISYNNMYEEYRMLKKRSSELTAGLNVPSYAQTINQSNLVPRKVEINGNQTGRRADEDIRMNGMRKYNSGINGLGRTYNPTKKVQRNLNPTLVEELARVDAHRRNLNKEGHQKAVSAASTGANMNQNPGRKEKKVGRQYSNSSKIGSELYSIFSKYMSVKEFIQINHKAIIFVFVVISLIISLMFSGGDRN